VHISTGLGLGGAESLLYECVQEGATRGYRAEVVSLTSGGSYAERLRDTGVPVTELGALANRANLPALWSLRKILKTGRPLIVQAWMYHANLFTLAAGLPAGISPARQLVWGIFAAKTDMRSYGRSTAMVAGLGARLSAVPAAIVYNARRAATDHAVMGYRPRREILIQNGIDTDRFRPHPGVRKRLRAELGIPDNACVAIMAARHHPQKDWRTALAGIRAIPGLITLAVGEGTEVLPDQRGLLRLGAREDMPALYAAADLFVLPSAYGEGTSVAMSEAMACGLPVIVTDVGDNAVYGAKAGFVVPTGDPAALHSRIMGLVSDAGMRERLGAEARKISEREFSRSRGFSALFNFYDSLS